MPYVLALVSVALMACTEGDSNKPSNTEKTASSAKVAASGSAKVKKADSEKRKTDNTGAFTFMKLAVGHFVEYRNGTKRYAWAVVGEEDDALWLQLVSDVDGKEVAMQMLVAIQDGTQIHTAKPKKMKFKMPGQSVKEMDANMLKMMGNRNIMDKNGGTFLLDMSTADINKGARESVTVKAGKFNAFRWKGKTKKGDATFWSDASVPIIGIVKGTDPDGTWELVKYGTSGAKSIF